MLMHATAHAGYATAHAGYATAHAGYATAHAGSANTVRESALKVDSGRKIPITHRQRIESASVLCLAFRSGALAH